MATGFWIPAIAGMTVMQRSPSARTRGGERSTRNDTRAKGCKRTVPAGRYDDGKVWEVFGSFEGGKGRLLIWGGFYSEGLQFCHPLVEPRTLRADDLEANLSGDINAVDNLLIVGHQFKYSLTRGTVAPVVNVLGRVESRADLSETFNTRACRICSPSECVYV